MTGRHRMWDGENAVEVDVPVSGGENVMVPVIRAIVRHVDDPHRVLIQRRDSASESVRGMLEIPGGRWRSGEPPFDAIAREVAEEAGVTLVSVDGLAVDPIDDRRTIATVDPLVVVAGVEGAFPAMHVVVVATGTGDPRSAPGESADVGWWHISELEDALEEHRTEFIPSSHAALRAYVEYCRDRLEE